jgi:hypothetical protein
LEFVRVKQLRRLLLIGAFAINGVHATAALSAEAGSFPLSEHGASGTLTSVTGKDSPDAIMKGRVTEADAVEACERNHLVDNSAKAKAAVRACIKAELASSDRNVRATANCPTFTIHTARGDSMTLVGYYDEANSGDGKWKMENGKLIEQSNLPPAVGRIADSQFKIMCPSFFGKKPSAVETSNAASQKGASKPYEGKWAMSVKHCRHKNGDMVGKDFVDGNITISKGRLSSFESTCRIAKATGGGDNYKLMLSCESEGESYKETMDIKFQTDDIATFGEFSRVQCP